MQKGSSTPGRESAGSLKKEDVLKIAEIKFADMGLDELGAATKAVEGTARSMGISVID